MSARPGWREIRFDVPGDVHAQLARVAGEEGCSVTEVARRLLLGAVRGGGESRFVVLAERERFRMGLEAVLLTDPLAPARAIARRALRIDG